MLVKDFENLDVYQLALDLQHRILEVTKSFPKAETYSLTDQIRRASRSIGANIAEAWAKRRYEGHFVSKLSDSDAEQMETRHWLTTAWRDGYIGETECNELRAMCFRIGQMLGSMMANSGNWAAPF